MATAELSREERSQAVLFTHSAADTAPTSSIAMAMMFGGIIFTTAAMASRTWLRGDGRAIRSALNPQSKALDVTSFESVFSLLYHFSVLGLILLFAYLCEYHPPFPHAEKSYDRDEFFFLTALLFLASAYTVHRNDGTERGRASPKKPWGGSVVEGGTGRRSSSLSTASGTGLVRPIADVAPANDFLGRDQTEEWKGWMQFIFLLYHYYSASEVYNSIRIMITCYVWMTGFGNFSFFYLKGDYSAARVLQMLWRLNFLVLFLCLSQGTTYILYYICPLHTYFFFMVYLTMRIRKDLNYSKYGVRFKLVAVAFVIYVVWDVDSGIFKLLHGLFLGERPVVGAPGGSMWEWYFRTTLDHWSTFLGMVFALNYPIISLFFRKLEAQSFRAECLGKGAVGAAILGCLYVWVTGPFLKPKPQYNETNAYFGFVPLLAYIYFRNLTPTLREYSLNLFHQIGKTTLETYLMQHHIWLTSNAKSLLVFLPGWPRVNMLVVTMLYFSTSRRLYKLTLYLRGMLLPDDRRFCVRSLLCLFGAIGGFYFAALALQSFGLTSLVAIGIISLVCGFILYQIVMDITWDAYRESAPNTAEDRSLFAGLSVDGPAETNDSSVIRFSPLIIGGMLVFILGVGWQGMAENGAGKIQTLPPHCTAYVNDGQWIPLDGCNEGSRGEGFRSYGTVNFATCGSTGGAYTWGWNMTESSSFCRFRRRATKELKITLNRRRLIFAGDSMTRNIYYAVLRSLGIAESGAYDATGPKHVGLSKEIGKIKVEFIWAPLADDQVRVFKEMNTKLAAGEEYPPDLVFAGGGTWDRLHQFATESDQDALKERLKELRKEMELTQREFSPVTWFIPTTINDPALNTEEKRDHMTEDDMEEMREIYEDLGVLDAASFVLDGPAFTAQRVKESYDGVHYPPSVYDAGAQILMNAFDWMLPESDHIDDFDPLQPGKMANPYLGLMMLCLIFVGLMSFDGFMGFLYIASIFTREVTPIDLYREAFATLHSRMNLPMNESLMGNHSSSSSIAMASTGGSALRSLGGSSAMATDAPSLAGGSVSRRRTRESLAEDKSVADAEIDALLGGGGRE